MSKITAVLFSAATVCLIVLFALCPVAQAGWKDKLHNVVDKAESRIKQEYSEVRSSVTQAAQPNLGDLNDKWTGALEKARAALATRNYTLAEQEYQTALSAATLTQDNARLKLTLEKFARCCREHASDLRKSAFLSFIPYDWVMGLAIVITLLPAGLIIWMMSNSGNPTDEGSAVVIILLLAATFSGVWSGFQGWTHAEDIAKVERWATDSETKLKSLN